jgi:hypothetical protein
MELFRLCISSNMGNKYILTKMDAFNNLPKLWLFQIKRQQQWPIQYSTNEFVNMDA